ncbi:MAG TPA: CpsD/CapB family tyrosine-protein kinase [Acidobacteriaceae bacterium]|nr:CpsD/CapB family tyrosine-protein kinase [Acidobacteriaceae bacterium]
MSKIYEALRQAELDRAKTGSTASEQGSYSSAVSQAVLDKEQAAPFASASRSTVSIASAGRNSSASAGSRSTLGDALQERPDAGLLDLTQVEPVQWNPSLVQLPALEERGSAVEQFRSLRSRMQEFRDLNALKTLMVSSGLPQEGKSFVAANLAISFARHKAGRVLLIDGDMRRATLHKLLGAPQGPGLTEYLAGTASVLDVMQRAISDDPSHPVPAGLASLTFIPAGTEHDKAADLSGNRRFDRLIKEVSPHFDWIVVDSSPVNLVSDGVNLARACDAVLLVARGGVTKYEVAQRAIAELKASKVLGLVLNAVKNPPAAGGYYGYDGYDKIEE